MIPEYDPSDHRQYSPTAAELTARVDRLVAATDAAERRIAEALAPEPRDYEAEYREILATVGRVAAAIEKGGA